MKTQLHRRCKDLQSIQGLWLVTVTDYIQWRLGLFTRPTCTVSWFSTEILSMHRWKQKQSATFFHEKVGCRCQSLRQFCLTSAAALWWNRMHDASTSLRQFWLTHADAFHFEIEKNALSRLPAHKHVRARLRHVGNPGTTQSAVVPPSTTHLKHSLDGATGEETVSLWATAWSHPPRCSHRPQWAKHTKSQRCCDWSHQSNETKCAWACLRWRQWLTVATVGSICFSSWRGISFAMLCAVPSRGPAASMWCHPTDNEYELHRAHWNNPSNSMELHAVSSQSHTWKQPLLQTRQDLLWWYPSCKWLASCQAAHLPFLWACKQGNHPQDTQLWMRSCNCVVGWFHPRPSMKQCHCTHPGCLFAWLATTSASHVATWMSLPENTGVFYLRKKLPNRTHAHTFKLWSEAHGRDKTKLLNQANLLGNSGTKRRFAVTHGNSDSSGCFTCETCKTK